MVSLDLRNASDGARRERFNETLKIGFYLIDELKAKDFDIRKAKRDEKREELYQIVVRR